MAEATELNPGMYFLHNNDPVKVVKREIVTYGTHCHSKLKFYVQGLYTKGEKIVTLAHTDKVEILDITRKSGTVLSKQQSNLQVMDSHSFETFDAETDLALLNDLKEGDEITFVSFNGKTLILEKR